ncbi:YagK/YfjJ domain-containing protein [Acinetobacter beijerinckii]|uniref:YagK/YfjJ domain-containing protein n=1 Tax=Acinetobacter beijerinckii TaxID=262668 RepID=UPI003016632A
MNTQTTTVNESEILIGIEQFIQCVLYTPRMSEQEFTNRLMELIPLFEMIEDPELEYCYSVEIFRLIADELRELQNVQSTSYLQLYDPYISGDKIHSPQISSYKSLITENQSKIWQELRAFRLQEKRNRKSLFEYLTKLTQHYAKLLFVRVDLGIQFKHQFDVGIEEFNFYMSRLLKRVHDQDTCFNDLQGYAWAIEQGEKKGYHCHLLLIYDGHKHQNDFGLASMVGECWKEITEDKGCFFTSNTPEYKHRLEEKGVLGIGMIHRENSQQVLNAINAAMYLVNPEKDGQYLRAWVKSMRTFGRGQYELNRRRGCLE